MPKLKKLLAKFSEEERSLLELLIEKIVSLDWRGLDVKKLKDHANIYRVRKGKLRVIFSKEDRNILVLAIERRSEDTYKF